MTFRNRTPALFLDRDGVINEHDGYVFTKEKFVFVEGVFELCRMVKKAGYFLVVVTNQSGIGRGLFSQEQFTDLTDWMKLQFAENSAELDLVLVATVNPGDPSASFVELEKRKPGAGMFFEAKKMLNLDLENSIMIGDSLTDIEAAILAGISTRFLVNPSGMGATEYLLVGDLRECIGEIELLLGNRNLL
jgi:D-glycero-D-manno-heptose 1,7-bisphosphate phosphatase